MGEMDGGIHAREPEPWKPQRVNLRGFLIELSKAITKVGGGAATIAIAKAPVQVMGGWSTIASAVPDAIAAFTHLGTLTEEQKAYILVRRTLSRAVAELVVEGRGPLPPDTTVGEDVFTQVEGPDPELVLDPDFLKRPREVKALRDAQPLLERWLQAQGMTGTQARTTAERLPTYFALSLHEELTQHAEFFAPLIKKLTNETAALSREVWAWERYHSELIREPYRPFFGEAFGLSPVFVPLRAVWKEKQGREQVERADGLEEALTKWLANEAREDGLRVLSGDLGSGKSSCAKMWAAEMAQAHPGWRVVFVQLHNFGYRDNLRESLKTYLKEEARIDADLLDPNCLDHVLLFFDGLDELAMPGKSARQAAVAFVREINTMLLHQNRKQRRVLVVLCARQLVVQDCGAELPEPHQILSLQSYSPEERRRWWMKYGEASGKWHTDLPPELQRPDLDTLTAQPLHNCLLAQIYDQKRLDFSGQVTVNAICSELLERVYERVWSAGGNVHLRGANQTVPRDKFEKILEEIGAAVWQSDSRSVTLYTIRDRCKKAELSEALMRLEDDSSDGVFRLLAASPVRSTEGAEKSIEFTHKCFGEYLAARRIARLMEDICEPRPPQNKQRGKDWDNKRALGEWATLCGPQPLDAGDWNLFPLLTNEVAVKDETQREEWRTIFVELAEEMIAQGMPIEQCGLSSYQEMDTQTRNAEEALLCALHTCLSPNTPEQHPDVMRPGYAAPLLARWHFRRGIEVWSLAFACVAALNHLKYSFEWSHLILADLTSADLTGADLTRANLTGADLTGANLSKAILTEASLTKAILTEANLAGANLAGANLTGANLTGANLAEPDSEAPELRCSDLTGADLTNAILTEAKNWQHATGINIEQVAPERRPRGWEEFLSGGQQSAPQPERREENDS